VPRIVDRQETDQQAAFVENRIAAGVDGGSDIADEDMHRVAETHIRPRQIGGEGKCVVAFAIGSELQTPSGLAGHVIGVPAGDRPAELQLVIADQPPEFAARAGGVGREIGHSPVRDDLAWRTAAVRSHVDHRAQLAVATGKQFIVAAVATQRAEDQRIVDRCQIVRIGGSRSADHDLFQDRPIGPPQLAVARETGSDRSSRRSTASRPRPSSGSATS
jgi:hypothetical protein